MKRLLVLGLIWIAVPAHGASDARDLIKALMLDQKAPRLEAWSLDAPAASGISWDKPGIEFDKSWNAYVRTGRVALKPHDDFTWQVTLIGPRAGPTGIELDTIGNLPQLGPGDPDLDGLELTPHRCDPMESPTFGMRIDVVEASGKKPAFLRREWSCGSAGCAIKLSLHQREGDVRAISDLPDPPPCPGAAEKQPAGAAP